jgi:hypothetical protein
MGSSSRPQIVPWLAPAMNAISDDLLFVAGDQQDILTKANVQDRPRWP